MLKLFFKSIYYKLIFKKEKLLEEIIPCVFQEVDGLISEYEQYDHAIQFLSLGEKIRHDKMIKIPFDWHGNQISLLENQPDGGGRFTSSHQTRAQYVSYMKNTTLLGGVLVNSSYKVNKDTAYHCYGTETNYYHFLLKPQRIINEPVFYLGETEEYYHWIMDCLSAIYLWKQLGFDKKAKLFVTNFTDFKRKTLKIYGVPDDRIIGDKSGHVKFKHVFIPSSLGGGQAWGPPSYLPAFHKDSVANIKVNKINKKYYISRSNTKKRRINNEVEVENLLKQKGFEILFLEDYSFEKQIKLMRSAALIVAPHGAGLTNIIYCQPKTIIVELLSGLYLNKCFYKISSITDLIYFPLVSSDYKKKGEDLHKSHWNVDLEQLDCLLNYLNDKMSLNLK